MTSHEQSTSAAGQSQQEADVQPATTPEQSQDEKRECPICKMMREGGCEKEFNDFMDCGAAADKGQRDYVDCIQMFTAMKECMDKNPAVFSAMLGSMDQPEDKPADAKEE